MECFLLPLGSLPEKGVSKDLPMISLSNSADDGVHYPLEVALE